jgi:hypothetical protein
MNNIWMLNISDFLIIYEETIILGKERGKKEGDNLEEEFFEVAKKKGLIDNIKHIGQSNKDIDLLTGDLREEGLKILNLNELKRQNDK